MQTFNEVVATIAIVVVFLAALFSDVAWDGMFWYFFIAAFLLWHAWKFMMWIALGQPEGKTLFHRLVNKLGERMVKH